MSERNAAYEAPYPAAIMDDPEGEIRTVVYRLTATSSPDIQKATVEKYMTPNVGFKHPICQVDSGPNSRSRVLGIFQWYRVLSPSIDIRIDSVVYDKSRDVMYLEITQWFKLFFLPAFVAPAPASLVTRLKLVKIHNLYYITEQQDFYPGDEFASLLLPVSVPLVRAALVVAGHLSNVGAIVAGFFGYWSPSLQPSTGGPGLYSDRED